MAKTTKAIDVVPVNDDLAFTREAGALVVDFLKRAAAFFRRGEELEAAARSTLATAKAWQAPTNKAEQVALQTFIRDNNAALTRDESHWDDITKPLFRMHKRFVGRREVTAALRREATSIGNSLHNAYVEAENRKAREEQQRLQKIADDHAKAQRDIELAQLEAEALKAEAASDSLSAREQSFVAHYLGSNNAPQAARLAGYKSPDAQALRLLQDPKVVKAIEAEKTARALRQQAAAVRQSPVNAAIVEVKADVTDGGDRTNWKAEVLDQAKFIEAVFAGTSGIPRDVLMIDQVRLNVLARELREQMARWPGVRAVPTTKVV